MRENKSDELYSSNTGRSINLRDELGAAKYFFQIFTNKRVFNLMFLTTTLVMFVEKLFCAKIC